MTANIEATTDTLPVSASAGSSVGGGKHGKRTATTKTPSVSQQAKFLKLDAVRRAEATLTRMLESCKGHPNAYSAGAVIDACGSSNSSRPASRRTRATCRRSATCAANSTSIR